MSNPLLRLYEAGLRIMVVSRPGFVLVHIPYAGRIVIHIVIQRPERMTATASREPFHGDGAMGAVPVDIGFVIPHPFMDFPGDAVC